MSDNTRRVDAGQVRRKRLKVDQRKLDRLVSLLCISEAEVVDKALDNLLFHASILTAVERFRGRGYEIENLFDEHLEL